MLERLAIMVVLWALWLIRRVLSLDPRTYVILSIGPLQPLLAWIGRLRARATFLRARKRCPAYRRFLETQDYRPAGRWRLGDVPVMTKDNYVRAYSIQDRCYYGKIPVSGVVIDESSGSSGTPNNWVRSAAEREDVKRILQLNFHLIYRDSGRLLLNCFALGPWATGMNVSMSMVDVGILKSIGPDRQKLENTLKLFGTDYHYLIFGYPPFMKSFVDGTALDLKTYRLDFVVGGEGMSEALRDHLLQSARSVISSYGASDLEINIGVETELTINLRRRCQQDAALSRALFGRDTPPMIFQYNALDYIIETSEHGELVFTIGRQDGAAPKIRYNLHDLGGVMRHRDLGRTLTAHGIDIATLAQRQTRFPLLYVYGRGDLTAAFYGAKVSPADIEQVIGSDASLFRQVNSFQIASYEDAQVNRRLKIRLEMVRAPSESLPDASTLRELFFDGLCRCNQDFREVTKMFERDCIEVEVHAFESGPFEGRDIRIKNKYIDAGPGG